MEDKKIRILLVDDHSLFRSGLKYLLENEDDFEVVGEATDGLEGIKFAEQLRPDVVLLDLDMPVMRGIEALPQLLLVDANMAILILTVSEESIDLTECMRLGARGYLLKNIKSEVLLDGIRKALDGDNVLSPEMTTKLIEKLKIPKSKNKVDSTETLTPREMEILVWLAKGASNKIIARSLDLAESTIKAHVQNILRKLKLNSRVQAAVYAISQGMLTEDAEAN